MIGNKEVQAKLARLHNRATAHEVVAERGQQRLCVAYTQRSGRVGLLNACRSIGSLLVALPGAAEELTNLTARSAKCGEWEIRYSGRTQREAYILGELPIVGECRES
jgi:hypothetical protein